MTTKDEYGRLVRLKLLRRIFDYTYLFGNISVDTLLYYYKYMDKKKDYLYENPIYVQNTFLRRIGRINETVQQSSGLETAYKYIFNKDGMVFFQISFNDMEKFRKERERNRSGYLIQ